MSNTSFIYAQHRQIVISLRREQSSRGQVACEAPKRLLRPILPGKSPRERARYQSSAKRGLQAAQGTVLWYNQSVRTLVLALPGSAEEEEVKAERS